MYTVADYGGMLADRVRTDAYRAALAAVVRPGHVVVDLGAGTGFFALEACRLGAKKVYAVDVNEAVELVRPLARRNGFGDRVVVVHKSSTELVLDEGDRADVIVSDLRGVLPFYDAHLSLLADARARLLRPGGVIIPERDDVSAALVDSPELYGKVVAGWEGHALDLTEARTASVNAFHHDRRAPVRPEQVLTEPARWLELVYGEPAPSLYERVVSVEVRRAGTAHGVAVWFDASLHGAIGFTTAPGSDRVYGRAFLPWERPFEVAPGDAVELELYARRDATDHLLAWGVRASRATGHRLTAQRQSTFFGVLASPEMLRKESGDYAPTLGVRGRALAHMLGQMDGAASVTTIAERTHAAHPRAFAALEEAVAEARRLARKYG